MAKTVLDDGLKISSVRTHARSFALLIRGHKRHAELPTRHSHPTCP